MPETSLLHPLMKRLAIACLPLALALAACGGGDPGASPAPAPVLASGSPVVEVGNACAGQECGKAALIEYAGSGALGEHQYGGQGTGLWHYRNDGDAEARIPVSIAGIDASSTVSLIYTNEDVVSHGFPLGRRPAMGMPPPVIAPPPEEPPEAQHCREKETAWNLPGVYIDGRTGRRTPVIHTHCATEVQAVRASDGREVRFWVEYSLLDDNRIGRNLVAAIARRFVTATPNAYDLLTQVTGPLWGPHQRPQYVAGDSPGAPQPLNIVFVDPRRRHAENFASLFASFNSENLHLFNDQQISARRLSVYINADAILNAGNFEPASGAPRPDDLHVTEKVKSLLAHELTHLANHYRRTVLPPAPLEFEGWLEEMSANQVQHIVDSGLGQARNPDTGDVYWHDEAKAKVAGWRRARGQCSLFIDRPGDECRPDDVSGAFGIYLAHQYGPAVYRNLLNATEPAQDSLGLLDAAIRTAGGKGLTDSLWRHGVALSLQPGIEPPAAFGFPKWVDGKDVPLPIRLTAIDAGALPELPMTVTPVGLTPDIIPPYGYIPMVRPAEGGKYEETLPVPPHSSVTVLIQKR